MAQQNIQRDLLAELMGTFILVFVGTAAVVNTQIAAMGSGLGTVQYLVIGWAFGVALMAAAYTVGPISGAHLNPAVTIGLAVEGRFSKDRVMPYIIAQCMGAFAASAVLLFILGTRAHGLGETTIGAYGIRKALLVEVILTDLLVFVVLGATDKGAPAGFAGLIIGLYLAASHLVGIPFSGNSLNPARSLGPALLMGGKAMEQLLTVYVLAPVAGGVIGALKYRFVKTGRLGK